MPMLLNRELVAVEMLELARHKIADALSVDPGLVTARWKVDGAEVRPSFAVDANEVSGATEDDIKRTMGSTWRWMKDELAQRIAGLSDRRASFGQAWVVARPQEP